VSQVIAIPGMAIPTTAQAGEFEKLSGAPLQKCFLKGFHCG